MSVGTCALPTRAPWRSDVGARGGIVRREHLWRLHLLVGGVLCAAFALVPPFKGNGVLMNLLGLSAVVAVVAGVRLHRPASAAPWLFFAAGLTLFWLGDLYTI